MMAYFLSLLYMVAVFFVNKAQHSSAACQGKGTMADNPLTSHVLDQGLGKPAVGVATTLFKLEPGTSAWIKIVSRETDQDGRIGRLLTDVEFTPGTYKFHFDTQTYYARLGTPTFYPFIEVVFTIQDPSQHYHVPILLSPFGFSTYRGS